MLFASLCTYGQNLTVLSAKKAKIVNGKSIKSHSIISVTNAVSIDTGGELSLSKNTTWVIRLKSGVYNLDSCYNVYKNRFAQSDSLFPFASKYLNCKVKPVCTTDYHGDIQELSFKSGNIGFNPIKYNKENGIVELTWRNPNINYAGNYFVIIKNEFEEVIEYKFVKNPVLYLLDKEYEYSILVNVYSDELVGSLPLNVKF
jgi:hypothetical protein